VAPITMDAFMGQKCILLPFEKHHF